MFSIHVSAGFRGLIPHLDQVTLYLYQDSNEKTIPLNIIVSASKFQSWKEGLVFVIALEISPSEKKTRYCWHITML